MFEKMFESRLFFVDKLIGMGARIVLCDPHRAASRARSRWRAEPRVARYPRWNGDAVAALARRGRSSIANIGQIERGYERIDERLERARRSHPPRAGAGGVMRVSEA